MEHRKAIGFVVTSTFAFALMAACVKSAKRLPFIEIVFMRGFIGLLFMLVFVPFARASFWGKRRKPLLVRAFAGVCALCLHFYAITHLPLATAMFLGQTSPLLVVMMATFFLKEKVTPAILGMILLGFFGTALLLQPDFYENPSACIAGLASGFFAAIAMIAIRYVGKAESALTSIFYFVLITAITTAPVALPIFVPPTPLEWLALVGIGFFSFLGQVWLTGAFRIGPASSVTAFVYLTPVFSYVLGYVFWGETLTLLANIGAVIIVLSGIGLSFLARGIKGNIV
ncbi:MAG: DMT family transporter [Candidatus Omnitrophica bacterium]|nr:DMT family transporter [Candidatus Omnitrophota bacterium]